MPLVVPTDLFAGALQMLGALGAAETVPPPENGELCRRTFNRLGGQWNNRKRNCYFVRTQAFPFTTAKQNYTIGAATNVPAPDFAVASGDRPLALEPHAQLVLTDVSPNVNLQLAVVNFDQYTLITIPALPSTFPNTIYYQPTPINGTIWPWPAFPTATSYKLQVSWRNQMTVIAAADVATSVWLPDGYEEAITLTLAQKLWLAFPRRTDYAILAQQASQARADAFSNNAPPEKIDTTDGATTTRASGFNWLTRLPG